ncbi:hypothetical protein ACFQU2_35740 [Siccirubricoccus deserti]
MKRSLLTDQQIAVRGSAPHPAPGGEVCRKAGISIQTYYLYGLLPLRKRSLGWV